MAASLPHESLFGHYYDDLIAFLKNFASYGWDAKSDRQAEACLQKHKEEMRLHYAGQDELWKGLALGATEHTREDLTNDRLESAVAVNIVTKEEIFRRFGDEDETPLQEENREMIKDPHNTALVHNHWNDSPGSQADFDAALWLGVRYLIVVTPSGVQYIYERNGDTMKLLDEIFNREHVALPSRAETEESREAYEAQMLAEAGNPAERVMRQGDELSQAAGRIHIPAGLTADQARQLFYDDVEDNRIKRMDGTISGWMTYEQAWGNRWKEDPESWYDYDAIDAVMPIIIDAAKQWNHPALGMSDDEVVALLTANLHREAYYRRKHPIVIGMTVGDVFRNFGDIVFNAVKDQGSGASVGPANLRVSVADEILGTRKIPMPGVEPVDFYDMGRLDELERKWQNLDEEGRKELLYDDEIAITLMAANLYRGAERLYQQYLDDQGGLEDYHQHQRLLAQGAVEQYRQERGIPQHFLEQAGRQKQYLKEYLQQDKDRATMFNMSAWLSQGIAESRDLRNALDNKAVTAAINHARETVPFVSGILSNNAFGLSTDQDGYIMFNEDDLHAYLRD